jgi:hypothetical protein
MLWASLQAELSNEPQDLTDRERLLLLEAFFDTMRARLDAHPAADSDEQEVVQMRKVAQYVV